MKILPFVTQPQEHTDKIARTHSMIKIVDLPYNTRDNLISFYLGK